MKLFYFWRNLLFVPMILVLYDKVISSNDIQTINNNMPISQNAYGNNDIQTINSNMAISQNSYDKFYQRPTWSQSENLEPNKNDIHTISNNMGIAQNSYDKFYHHPTWNQAENPDPNKYILRDLINSPIIMSEKGTRICLNYEPQIYDPRNPQIYPCYKNLPPRYHNSYEYPKDENLKQADDYENDDFPKPPSEEIIKEIFENIHNDESLNCKLPKNLVVPYKLYINFFSKLTQIRHEDIKIILPSQKEIPLNQFNDIIKNNYSVNNGIVGNSKKKGNPMLEEKSQINVPLVTPSHLKNYEEKKNINEPSVIPNYSKNHEEKYIIIEPSIISNYPPNRMKGSNFKNIEQLVVESIKNPKTILIIPDLFEGDYAIYGSIIDYYLPEFSEFAIIRMTDNTDIDYNIFKTIRAKYGLNPPRIHIRNRALRLTNGFQTDLESLKRAVNSTKNLDTVQFLYPNGTTVSFIDNVHWMQNDWMSDIMLIKFGKNGYSIQWPVFRDVLKVFNIFFRNEPEGDNAVVGVTRPPVTKKLNTQPELLEFKNILYESTTPPILHADRRTPPVSVSKSNPNLENFEQLPHTISDFLITTSTLPTTTTTRIYNKSLILSRSNLINSNETDLETSASQINEQATTNFSKNDDGGLLFSIDFPNFSKEDNYDENSSVQNISSHDSSPKSSVLDCKSDDNYDTEQVYKDIRRILKYMREQDLKSKFDSTNDQLRSNECNTRQNLNPDNRPAIVSPSYILQSDRYPFKSKAIPKYNPSVCKLHLQNGADMKIKNVYSTNLIIDDNGKKLTMKLVCNTHDELINALSDYKQTFRNTPLDKELFHPEVGQNSKKNEFPEFKNIYNDPSKQIPVSDNFENLEENNLVSLKRPSKISNEVYNYRAFDNLKNPYNPNFGYSKPKYEENRKYNYPISDNLILRHDGNMIYSKPKFDNPKLNEKFSNQRSKSRILFSKLERPIILSDESEDRLSVWDHLPNFLVPEINEKSNFLSEDKQRTRPNFPQNPQERLKVEFIPYDSSNPNNFLFQDEEFQAVKPENYKLNDELPPYRYKNFEDLKPRYYPENLREHIRHKSRPYFTNAEFNDINSDPDPRQNVIVSPIHKFSQEMSLQQIPDSYGEKVYDNYMDENDSLLGSPNALQSEDNRYKIYLNMDANSENTRISKLYQAIPKIVCSDSPICLKKERMILEPNLKSFVTKPTNEENDMVGLKKLTFDDKSTESNFTNNLSEVGRLNNLESDIKNEEIVTTPRIYQNYVYLEKPGNFRRNDKIILNENKDFIVN